MSVLVVSDTSPIRALAHLVLLDTLAALYESVVVPPAVVAELAEPGVRFPALDVAALRYVRVTEPTDLAKVKGLETRLERGEAEAIVVALELGANALLMDEARGRTAAKELGLPVVGTLGVLAQAKDAGLLPEVRPLINRLVNELNFFLNPALIDDFLEDIGE